MISSHVKTQSHLSWKSCLLLSGVTLALITAHCWIRHGLEVGEMIERYMTLGLSWEGVSELKFWQLYTYAFFHADVWHLTTNSVFLILIGWRASVVFPLRGVVAITLLGLLAGGLLHVVIDYLSVWQGNAGVTLVGFSATCFALLFAVAAMAPQQRIAGLSLRWANLALGVFIFQLICLLIMPSLGIPWLSAFGEALEKSTSEYLFRINYASHIGGSLAGWFCGRYLRKQVEGNL